MRLSLEVHIVQYFKVKMPRGHTLLTSASLLWVKTGELWLAWVKSPLDASSNLPKETAAPRFRQVEVRAAIGASKRVSSLG